VKVITVGAPLRCALLLGETLLCGSTTGCIYAVPVTTPGDGAKGSLTSEAQVPRWKGHSDAVVCLTQAEGLVLSRSYDNQARLWDAAGRCLCVFAGHTNGVKGVFVVSPQFVPTAARDETVRLWAVPEGSGAGESEAPLRPPVACRAAQKRRSSAYWPLSPFQQRRMRSPPPGRGSTSGLATRVFSASTRRTL
jgi:WD40 repeat protein